MTLNLSEMDPQTLERYIKQTLETMAKSKDPERSGWGMVGLEGMRRRREALPGRTVALGTDGFGSESERP